MTDKYIKCKCGNEEFVVQETIKIVKIADTKHGFVDEQIDSLLFPKYKYFCGKCNTEMKI
jgi:hypothetical protein